MIRAARILLVLMSVAACSGQPPVPEDHFYRLTQPSTAASAAVLTGGAIFVERFIADGVHRDRALTYMVGSDSELKQHHYHHWIDSPARLLRDHLIDYLRASAAAAVVTDSPTEAAGLSIYGKIRQFDIVSRDGMQQVAVALEFRVETPTDDRPPFVRAYERRREAGERTLNGAVEAFSGALDDIFSQLVEDLRGSSGG
ncbi:MAG: ABC-type transport auxiliary lipoprotein family protein [Gammaproteobacteria bacterium]